MFQSVTSSGSRHYSVPLATAREPSKAMNSASDTFLSLLITVTVIVATLVVTLALAWRIQKRRRRRERREAAREAQRKFDAWRKGEARDTKN